MTRFILYLCMAFITAFVGVTWAARGFPVHFSSAVNVGPLQPTVTATFGDQSAKDYERKMWEAEHTAQSDKDPKLDKIRLETLQAANAYAMSPCDDTMKSNLIAALTAYTRAWQQKMDCPRPQNMLMFCSEAFLRSRRISCWPTFRLWFAPIRNGHGYQSSVPGKASCRDSSHI